MHIGKCWLDSDTELSLEMTGDFTCLRLLDFHATVTTEVLTPGFAESELTDSHTLVPAESSGLASECGGGHVNWPCGLGVGHGILHAGCSPRCS